MDRDIPDRPLISVLMCTYNSLPFVEEAVGDILAQTCGDFELVIGDDGSTDGTREWLRGLTDERVSLHLHERNLGYLRNKNYLHRIAKGTFITQQDGDDRSHPERLERQLAVLREGRYMIAGCDHYRIDRDGRAHYPAVPAFDTVVGEPLELYPFWFPALMVHRSVFDRVGYFDEYFDRMYGDDYYWTIRANELFPIYGIGDALYGYRDNPGSLTNVLTSGRQILLPGILRALREQRRATGSDPIERGDLDDMRRIEEGLRANRRYMAGQLRIWAARLVDSGRLREARRMLARAWRTWPFDPLHYRTAYYLLRRSLAWAARR